MDEAPLFTRAQMRRKETINAVLGLLIGCAVGWFIGYRMGLAAVCQTISGHPC